MTYNTRSQSPVWNFFDPDEVEIVGGVTSATNAGTYPIQFKPRMKYVFPNGTKKIYPTTWTINKAAGVVSLSESQGDVKIKFTRAFVVNRLGDGVISATSRNTSIATVSVSGNVVTVTGVGVGQTVIDIKVAEGTNYLATQATYTVRSSKTQIPIPTVSNTTFTYSGKSVSPTIIDAPPTSAVIYGGTSSSIKAGNYSLTFAFRDTSAYEWANGSTATLSFPWSIAKLVFAKPGSRTEPWTVNALPVVKNFDSNFMNLSGTRAAKELGTHSATVSLKDTKSTCWSDGSTDTIDVTLTIVKRSINIHSDYGIFFTYNGREHDATEKIRLGIARDNPGLLVYDYMSIGGTVRATEVNPAGSYHAYVNLIDPDTCEWADGSSTTRGYPVYWVIRW